MKLFYRLQKQIKIKNKQFFFKEFYFFHFQFKSVASRCNLELLR